MVPLTRWEFIQGKSMKAIMKIYADSVSDIAVILLIISGAGALKQVFADSGVSAQIGQLLMGIGYSSAGAGLADCCGDRVCLVPPPLPD